MELTYGCVKVSGRETCVQGRCRHPPAPNEQGDPVSDTDPKDKAEQSPLPKLALKRESIRIMNVKSGVKTGGYIPICLSSCIAVTRPIIHKAD